MFRLVKLIIWILVIWFIVFYINYNNFKNETIQKDKVITIKKWDILSKVLVRELQLWEFFTKSYLKLNPEYQFIIQAWDYRVKQWDNIKWIIDTIKKWPESVYIEIKILEWWNIYDIDECLSNPKKLSFIKKDWSKDWCLYYKSKSGEKVFLTTWIINPWEFISEAGSVEKYIKDFPFLKNSISLEWYLYPNTYFINPINFKVEYLNKQMLESFKKEIYTQLLSTINQIQINEIINLASIVEKESSVNWGYKEKTIIAWILFKRYKENWMIWADITACYNYKLTSNDCKMNLSKYIFDKNEYNTRAITWLPKTPICNPSFDSVSAVINKEQTPYYYYLHDSSWTIHYARTNQEHTKNKNYLR